jgi:hypothetical protein
VVATETKRRRPATVRDMLLSLGVVGAAIGLFVLLLPQTAHQKVTPVEYLPVARALASESKLPIFVPDPPPPGWQANYVHVGSEPDALHVGFVLDAKTFAQLDETARPNTAFFEKAHVSDQPSADTAGGYQVRREGKHVALLRQLPGGGVLTISDGGTSSGASLDQLLTLARSLHEQPG